MFLNFWAVFAVKWKNMKALNEPVNFIECFRQPDKVLQLDDHNHSVGGFVVSIVKITSMLLRKLAKAS